MPGAETAEAMLARLVAFDTTSARSNLACAEWIAAELARHGIASRLIAHPSLPKHALHARIGPAAPGGVVLSGHMDCVPVDGQAWAADPFAMRRERERLIGRGVADMKGFLACCLALAPRFAAAPLKRPIHLCFSFDEETTFAGVPLLIEALRDEPPVEAAIIGEPTGMQAVIGHKGYASWDAVVTGATGHSSRTHATANALEAAAEAVVFLRRAARRLALEGRRAEGYEPAHSTVHVGSFHAGTILNIVPDRAEFAFEMRHLPGDSPAELLAALQAHMAPLMEDLRTRAPEAAFRLSRRAACPPLALPETHPLVGRIKRLASRNGVARVAYGSEAGFFEEAGIAAIICGPGDIAQAHQPEEWIARSEIAACCVFLERLAAELAA